MVSGGGVHKESGACPNGCGRESSPVGIPGASGRRPHRAPLARTHYRVTFRTAAAPPTPPCQVSPLDWDKLCRGFYFFILCHILSRVQRELNLSPSCHLHKKVHKSSRHGGWLHFFFFKDVQVQRGQTLKLQHWLIICEWAVLFFSSGYLRMHPQWLQLQNISLSSCRKWDFHLPPLKEINEINRIAEKSPGLAIKQLLNYRKSLHYDQSPWLE